MSVDFSSPSARAAVRRITRPARRTGLQSCEQTRRPSAADSSAVSSPAAEVTASSDWRSRRSLGWITSDGRPLAVRVDTPAGQTVGAVVISPPVGREAVVAIRTTTALALAAAEAGFVAFSYSPSGEGDSGDLRPSDDLARAWSDDLAAIVAAAREHVGPQAPVHVIGVRVGACLLDGLAESGPGTHLAWEPVSGRTYLRTHSIIRGDSIDVPEATDGTELEGVHYTTAQARSLTELRAPRRGPGVLLEDDRRTARHIALGAPYFAHVPMGSIRRIVDGLEQGVPCPTVPWQGDRIAHIELANGTRVSERRVTLGSLPAVVTTCPGVPMRVGATFTAMGSEIKAGPGRLWAQAARELAPRGVVSVRADRSCIGDDTGPAQRGEPRPYTDACVADVTAPATYLRRHGLGVVGVGVCAGAWSLLRAACGGVFDEVIAVNPVHWNPDESAFDEAFYRHYHGGDVPGMSGSTLSADDGVSTVDGTSTGGDDDQAGMSRSPRALAQRLLQVVETRRPGTRRQLRSVTERASKELAIRHPRVRSAMRPEVPLDLVPMLLSPLRRPLRVTLLFGAEEYRIFCGKGGLRAAAAARRRGVDVAVSHDPVVDHSLFSRAGREHTLALLAERLSPADVMGDNDSGRTDGGTHAP